MELITQEGVIKFSLQIDSLLYYKRIDPQLLQINLILNRLLFTDPLPCEVFYQRLISNLKFHNAKNTKHF